MPRPRDLPPDDDLKKLLEKGLTHQQIADAYGVTQQAVSGHVRLNNLAPAPPRYPAAVPWFVKAEHRGQYALRMLRLYGKRESGKPLKPGQAAMLERYEKRLAGLNDVVDYAEDIGFYLTPRRKTDKGLIHEPKA